MIHPFKTESPHGPESFDAFTRVVAVAFHTTRKDAERKVKTLLALIARQTSQAHRTGRLAVPGFGSFYMKTFDHPTAGFTMRLGFRAAKRLVTRCDRA